MHLFDEFFLIIKSLEKHQVSYCVIGGLAMAFHDQPRFTKDIDLLIAGQDLQQAKKILSTLGYFESTDPLSFPKSKMELYRMIKTENEESMIVDMLVGHLNKHQTIIENAQIEEFEAGKVRIAKKEDIVWLKQFGNSDQDQVDIKLLKGGA
jgi:hypothetical protein